MQEKAKAGYTTGYADPEFIGDLPLFNLPFLSRQPQVPHLPAQGRLHAAHT
ncbi:MAG: hypothetical protein MZV63_22565 [Marinilabiliales bacterium]|nr:hypothetical protein [Marinilabiliales bacterium]